MCVPSAHEPRGPQCVQCLSVAAGPSVLCWCTLEHVGLGWGVGPRTGQVPSTVSSVSVSTGVLVSGRGSSGSGKSRSPSWPRPEALPGRGSTLSRREQGSRSGQDRLAGWASRVRGRALWHLQQVVSWAGRDRAPSPPGSVTGPGAGRRAVARQCPPCRRECGERLGPHGSRGRALLPRQHPDPDLCLPKAASLPHTPCLQLWPSSPGAPDAPAPPKHPVSRSWGQHGLPALWGSW